VERSIAPLFKVKVQVAFVWLVLMNKFPLDMDIVLNKFFEIRLRKCLVPLDKGESGCEYAT
jgi:hypothetical protein